MSPDNDKAKRPAQVASNASAHTNAGGDDGASSTNVEQETNKSAPGEIDQPPTTNIDITGPAVIQAALKDLPSSPGVYRMLDHKGDVIYVGKARSLKARVSNYARLGGHTNRIARMIAATAAMEFVTVRTEAEALLRTRSKETRPSSTVMLRTMPSSTMFLWLAGLSTACKAD